MNAVAPPAADVKGTVMKKEMKLKISVIINLLIGFVTAGVMVWSVIDVNTSNVYKMSGTGELFKYFTIQSNVLSGIVSIIFAVFGIRKLKGVSSDIPTALYVMRLAATAGVSLTMTTVLVYLGPIFGYAFMLTHTNLFFHLLLPLSAIVSFVFFDTTDKISFRSTLFSLTHFALYAAFYLSVALSHVVNGKVDLIYDWYSFTTFGIPVSFAIAAVLGGVIYGFALLLRKLNSIVYRKERE